ncbi:hypothetical protein EON76_06745 [bacterium]|nr:MAG: hypothetical protein EON76_06745 [bacterium]
MEHAPNPDKQQELLSEIHTFVRKAQGLRGTLFPDGKTRISQAIDDKFLEFASSDLEGVLSRSDTEGQEFLQVNFCSGKKVLITTTLIGFKPIALKGLDLAKLPRVVTTPDIFSVFEAVQDALHAVDTDSQEITVLKKVFEAVIAGGESVGFDLSKERALMARIPSSFTKLAA